MRSGAPSMTEPETSAVETADSSSSMVALRTIVMIAFLVAIPLMAVFGTGLPSSLRTAMQGGTAHSHPLAAGEPAPSANTTNKLAESAPADKLLAPGGVEATGGIGAGGAGHRSSQPSPGGLRAPRASIVGVRASDGLPRARITQVRPADDSPPASASAPPPTAPLWAPAPRTATTPQSRNTTVHYSASGSRHRAAPPQPAQPAGAEATWQATAFSAPIAEAPVPASDRGDSASDPFARGEQRLRQYGATRYRLESWGDGGELFRCSANVALPDHPHGARHFEAVAASPSQAVDRMLEQIEAWRAAKRQAFNVRR